MPGLTQMFSLAAVQGRIHAFANDKEKRAFEALSYVGVEVVNHARLHGNYRDRTGNLRASVGYAVVKDGRVAKEAGFGQAPAGAEKGADVVEQLAEQFPEGLVLIVVAGMEYAAAVESKGYDVLTGGAQVGEGLVKEFKAALGRSGL